MTPPSPTPPKTTPETDQDGGRVAATRPPLPPRVVQEVPCEMTIDLNDALPAVAGDRPFTSVEAVVRQGTGDEPIHCLWPDRLTASARHFADGFRGVVAYAVKCNPSPRVITLLHHSGIRDFDVASRAEIDLVLRAAPDARLWYMHPVKSRHSIRHAWERGVSEFSLDSVDELRKLVEVLGRPPGLGLHVRLAVPSAHAAWSLGGKFGAAPPEAAAILREARSVASCLGLCFHVGSQCMSPLAYAEAIGLAAQVAGTAEVRIDLLDVGGGFPARYPGMQPPPLEAYFDTIHRAVDEAGFGEAELIAEPGRALVASSGATLVQVEHRRGDSLHINDGTYGSLFDAGSPGWRYPVRLLRPDRPVAQTLAPFRFLGPTCDSLDVMEGPFELPDDVATGDWIEIQQLGAYGSAMRTGFNGFRAANQIALILPEDPHDF